jgi:hypothetical protein
MKNARLTTNGGDLSSQHGNLSYNNLRIWNNSKSDCSKTCNETSTTWVWSTNTYIRISVPKHLHTGHFQVNTMWRLASGVSKWGINSINPAMILGSWRFFQGCRPLKLVFFWLCSEVPLFANGSYEGRTFLGPLDSNFRVQWIFESKSWSYI